MTAIPRWDDSRKLWIYAPQIDGRRKFFYSPKTGRPGMLECKRRAAEWVQSGGLKDRRFRDAWPDYLKDVTARTGPANLFQRESHGRTYLTPAIGYKLVNRITDQDWQDIINAASQSGTNGKPLSKKSLNNIRGTITDFAHWAKKSRLISDIPDLDIPRKAKTGKRTIIQPADIKKLFEDSDHWYLNAWRLMAVTGLRPGETIGLSRFDVADGYINVRRSIDSKGKETPGKNINALRSQKIHSFSQKIINDQIAMLEHAHVSSEWLFPAHDGGPVYPHTFYMSWRRYAAPRGIQCTPYELRHSFVSIMQNDLPESLLKRIVGHGKSMDTYGTYAHKTDTELTDAADIIERRLTTLLYYIPPINIDKNQDKQTGKGLKTGTIAK